MMKTQHPSAMGQEVDFLFSMLGKSNETACSRSGCGCGQCCEL